MSLIVVKYVITSVLMASSLMNVPDEDGWVTLERPAVSVGEEVEEEGGAWVVFRKQMDLEKFTVSFPKDPVYTYVPGGVEMAAVGDGGAFSLSVLEKIGEDVDAYFNQKIQEISAYPDVQLLKVKRSGSGQLDLCYRVQGTWVWERIVATPHSLYSFRTEGGQMMGDEHRQFIASLEVSPR